MRNVPRIGGLALCLATRMTATVARADEATVRAAVGRFYAAPNDMFTGDDGPMLRVWSHAGNITYIRPAGGLHVG